MFPSSSSRMIRRRRTEATKPVDDTCCESCGSGDSPAELLLCDKCDRGYHMFCLRPILVSVPRGSWFCPPCSKPNLTSFPLVQTKIIDFFRIERNNLSTHKPTNQESRKRKKRSSCISMKKKLRRLLPFVPTQDPNRRLQQMASLATALTATRTEFSDKLTYTPGMAPRSANSPALEREGMQVMSREDSETLNLCKKMLEGGEWPPLMVVFDPQEGFTVEADKSIKDLTIITEYTGDVDYLKNRENDDGDSIMTLLSTSDPNKSLVICPDKRGNIARFINGINNHTQEGKRKQNLKSVRFNVNGECRVLLIANRDIRRGERLYYNYNGYEQEYPTENFL
uniref:[histone H3]-lysine(27) N-methyltransferase n=1 Tax=Kalanchoe fedtschenkoi TaxID=63787 RepID=A0A7N0RED1_KALFE